MGEEERQQLNMAHSGHAASLYQSHLKDLAHLEKIERYRSAYARDPSTPQEDALTHASESALFNEEP
jgi:hypothetical protein